MCLNLFYVQAWHVLAHCKSFSDSLDGLEETQGLPIEARPNNALSTALLYTENCLHNLHNYE